MKFCLATCLMSFVVRETKSSGELSGYGGNYARIGQRENYFCTNTCKRKAHVNCNALAVSTAVSTIAISSSTETCWNWISRKILAKVFCRALSAHLLPPRPKRNSINHSRETTMKERRKVSPCTSASISTGDNVVAIAKVHELQLLFIDFRFRFENRCFSSLTTLPSSAARNVVQTSGRRQEKHSSTSFFFYVHLRNIFNKRKKELSFSPISTRRGLNSSLSAIGGCES